MSVHKQPAVYRRKAIGPDLFEPIQLEGPSPGARAAAEAYPEHAVTNQRDLLVRNRRPGWSRRDGWV